MAEKEYIERGKVLEIINSYGLANGSALGRHSGIADEIAERVQYIPAADVAEVVRCKDCKHSYFEKSCSKYECKKCCGALKYSNDFCSYGERKEATP